MNIQTEIKVKVLLFGSLAELMGRNEFEIKCNPSFNEFKKILFIEFPLLQTHSLAYAYNKKIITEDLSLENQAEIALLPPFSGG